MRFNLAFLHNILFACACVYKRLRIHILITNLFIYCCCRSDIDSMNFYSWASNLYSCCEVLASIFDWLINWIIDQLLCPAMIDMCALTLFSQLGCKFKSRINNDLYLWIRWIAASCACMILCLHNTNLESAAVKLKKSVLSLKTIIELFRLTSG